MTSLPEERFERITMPFTFSHPAAVMPLAKTGLSLSALVVGSMSPDFPYFAYLEPDGEFTHTLPGIFLFCLPAGLLVLSIYHLFVKMPLMSMLHSTAPQSAADSTKPAGRPTIRRLASVSLSVLIGALSHVTWDAFTHETGWIVQYLPFLQVKVFDLGFDQVPLTRILHHASSVLGALLLIVWARGRMRRLHGRKDGGKPPELIFGRTIRIAMLWISVSAVAGLLYAWTQGRPIQNYVQLRQMMVQALVAAGSAFFSIALFYSVFWHMTKRIGAGRMNRMMMPSHSQYLNRRASHSFMRFINGRFSHRSRITSSDSARSD